MIRKLFSLSVNLFLVSILASFGQNVKSKELTFQPAEVSFGYDKVLNYRENSKFRNYFIHEIIDSRVKKDQIGEFRKSNSTYQILKFPMPLPSEISNFLILSGFKYTNTNKDSVQLEIERFEYIRNTNDRADNGSIYITLNFYSTSDILLYQYNFELKNKDFLFNYNVAIKTMRDAILNALYVFNYVSDNYQPIRYDDAELLNYSELFNSPRKKGFYASLDELQHNNPSMSLDFEINKEKNITDYHKWEVIFKDSIIENRKQTFFDNCIGFSDGEEIYVGALSYGFKFGFNPLLEKGRYLYFVGKGTGGITNGTDGAGIDFGSGFMVGYLFGIAGGLVVTAIAAIPVEYESVIDLKTGKLYIVDDSFLDKIILTVPDLKDKYEKNPNRYEPSMKQLWIKEINKIY